MREFQSILDEAATANKPWTIEGALEGVAVLYGAPGVGKTFVACSIAASVASGRPWLGRQTSRGPVVYIAGEGGEQTICYRLKAAFDQLHCCDWYGEDEGVAVYVHGPGLNLVAGPDQLIGQIGQARITPELIIVDTLSRAFVGDENKQDDMGKFVRSLDILRATYKSSVLVIHHTNKSGKMRGSSVLNGAVDVQLYMEKDPRAADSDDHYRIIAEKLRERDSTDFECRLRFGSTALYGKKVSDDDPLPLRDHADGEVLTTRVVELPQDVLSLMALLSTVGLKMLESEARLTFIDWFNSAKATTRGKTLNRERFKAAMAKLLPSPGLYGIEQVSPGIFQKASE